MYGNAAPFFRFVDNSFHSTHASHSLSHTHTVALSFSLSPYFVTLSLTYTHTSSLSISLSFLVLFLLLIYSIFLSQTFNGGVSWGSMYFVQDFQD
jgi:hypothetical protein